MAAIRTLVTIIPTVKGNNTELILDIRSEENSEIFYNQIQRDYEETGSRGRTGGGGGENGERWHLILSLDCFTEA